MIYDIGIIGAGASGMMAAVAAYREGLRICLFEHNDKTWQKNTCNRIMENVI